MRLLFAKIGILMWFNMFDFCSQRGDFSRFLSLRSSNDVDGDGYFCVSSLANSLLVLMVDMDAELTPNFDLCLQ